MILVYVERETDGTTEVSEVSREALTFARTLAAAGGGIAIDAVVVGDIEVSTLAAYGVRDIHQATGEAFESYSAAAYAAAVQAARAAAGSVVVMSGGGPLETEVIAHVAAREGVAMAANVVSFGGLAPFVVTRQVVGGQAMEEMQLDERPAVFTVAGHAVEAAPADTPGAGTVKPLSVEVKDADLVARVRSTAVREAGETGDLKKARIVVGAGRGAGGADGFTHVDELAAILGGTVGVSRVVTSLGWRPHHEQVGQTGTRISPEVYIPCGISGAIQHWAGCSSSKVILAINTDAEAPMVTKATYAVIGDMHEVLPALNEALRS
ncbi:electron transfer flavoprotein subunit alpha/FixB family protein [Nocardioides bigeumensis]|uniref:Electron transfer flavoprotein subunit alpha/FixB family protein n=1 Tax=Nocardioides bigeumensis TaxID=433657 RepID=A0ABP5KNH0_9ACTN